MRGWELLREGLLTGRPLLLQYRGGPQVAARGRRGCHTAECFDKPVQNLGRPLVNIAGQFAGINCTIFAIS